MVGGWVEMAPSTPSESPRDFIETHPDDASAEAETPPEMSTGVGPLTGVEPPPGRLAAVLDEQIGDYARAARAQSTWRAYGTDMAAFEHWCAAQDPPEQALPAAPVVLARYLVTHAEARRPGTLQRWCAAIAAAHDVAGYPSPTRDEQVRTVLAGIRRTHRTRPARVAAAAPADLRAMLDPLDPGRARDARDRALLLIGFAAALRRSELAALRVDDLLVDAEGLRVFIAASKTDQEATPSLSS